MSTTPEAAVTEAAAKAAEQARAEAEHEKEMRSVRWWVALNTVTSAVTGLALLFFAVGMILNEITARDFGVQPFIVALISLAFIGSYTCRTMFMLAYMELAAEKP